MFKSSPPDVKKCFARLPCKVLSTVGSGVVRDSEKSEVAFLDEFRPRITMGNPIVNEISGFSDVGFLKIEKFSAKKSKK